MESEQYLMRMIWQRCAPNVMTVVTLMTPLRALSFICFSSTNSISGKCLQIDFSRPSLIFIHELNNLYDQQ